MLFTFEKMKNIHTVLTVVYRPACSQVSSRSWNLKEILKRFLFKIHASNLFRGCFAVCQEGTLLVKNICGRLLFRNLKEAY